MKRKTAHSKGIRIYKVATRSDAAHAGLRAGDQVLFVNGNALVDEFDFRYHAANDVVKILLERHGVRKEITLLRSHNTMLGIDFCAKRINCCANRCIFCFIDQMPKGLRKSLYIKDEDLGHSFVNGNYVTLSHTPFSELERIASIGLSPLYISVHATDPDMRLRLLGTKRAIDISEQLLFLEKHGVRFHTQIVVCPGFNDGEVLKKSVKKLLSFKRGLLSIAIVPVGLTRFRRVPLAPVTKTVAIDVCDYITVESDKDRILNGERRLFCADEFFIKAGKSIPSSSYYEDYPQIENGVGLVRQLLDEWKNLKKELAANKKRIVPKKNKTGSKRILVVTSESAYAYISKIMHEINAFYPGHTIDTVAAHNDFFGGYVTVAGLLTAHDVRRTVRVSNAKANARYDKIILPQVMFNHNGNTLDGFSVKRISTLLKTKIIVVDSLLSLIGNI